MAGRTEARIFTSIWRDYDFIALPPGAQRLYMFLLSQDDLSYCGVMPLRPRRWATKANGLTLTEVEHDLKWLQGSAYPTGDPAQDYFPTPLVITDEDTGELMVRSLLRRDGIWKQPNLLKLAIESGELTESGRIRGALLAELRRLPLEETGSAQVKTLVTDFIAILEKDGPYPTAYPSPHPSDDSQPDPSDDPTAKDYARAQGSGGSVATYRGIPEPLIPDAPNSSLPAQARKRATRLPDDFAPDADLLGWAAEKAPHVDPARETERFCDYWRAKAGRDGAKLDWSATWRNWMRTAEDRQGPRDRSVSRKQAEDDAMFEEAAQRIAARRKS